MDRSRGIRYSLHKYKEQGKPKKKGHVRGDEMNKRGWKKFRKVFRYFILFALLFLFLNWVGNIYDAVTTMQLRDVLESSEEVFEVSDERGLKRTLLVYEDISEEGPTNLFIMLIVYNVDSSEVLFYYLPQDLYIQDDFGEIYVSIGNLTYAGNTYMYGHEHAYVLSQIASQTAIDVDSYIWVESDLAASFFSPEHSWGTQKDEVLSIFSKFTLSRLVNVYYRADMVSESLYSNLTFMDIHRYFNDINAVVSSREYEYVNLGEEDFVREIELNTGRIVDVLDLPSFDNSIKENYGIISSEKLAREQVNVEVYNATDIPLYAWEVARKINNLGCNVVRYENTSYDYEEDYVYVSEKQGYSVALETVKSVIDNPVIEKGRPEFLTTGDIVVVLGGNE